MSLCFKKGIVDLKRFVDLELGGDLENKSITYDSVPSGMILF